TIGSSIARKEFMLKNIAIKVNIWDIGGQKSFNPLNPVFFTNVDAAFLVFDLTQPKETLPELEIDYLTNLSKYTNECIAFVIGNKSDLISTKKELENIANHYKIKNLPLILISAKTQENLYDAFDLIIFSFLKEWEKGLTSKKFHGISKEFLNLINKTEEQLKDLFVNLGDVDSILISSKAAPQLTKKKISSSVPDLNSVTELVDYVRYKEKIEEFNKIKGQIIDSFDNKLTIIKDLISSLKRTPINSLIDTIDNTMEQLNDIKADFEFNLDSLLNLEKSEKKVKEEME
ncbi:unnamed protein product, partial [marine sediment metagenome]